MMDRISAIISYSNLKHNLEVVKAYAKGKSIICMVKDNAYGHGSVNISKILEKDDSVKAFAVASVSEANSLYEGNIKKDILIITHIDESNYLEAIERGYILTISTYEQAVSINEKAYEIGKKARVEIAIDSGMGRIGFIINDNTASTIEKISKLSNIFLYDIFTHFSVADADTSDYDNIKYTDKQENDFIDLLDRLKKLGVEFNDVSISNSAGILTNRGKSFTSVRAGIILYGHSPSKRFDDVDLKPILSIKSKIIHIKDVDGGKSISYGRNFITDKKMRIATVSCGYGDGYPRKASNLMDVIINDTRCRIIGNITMDMLMVDVSGINCKVGDEVIIIGESANEAISVRELCDKTGEFNYEILTRISERVKRSYI